MKRLLSIVVIFCILSSLITMINASEPKNTYTEEEKHLVSNIFDGCGPVPFSVLNTNIDSLSETDKFCLCRESLASQATLFFDMQIPFELFSNHYYDMFGEVFPEEIGAQYEYYQLGLSTEYAINTGLKYIIEKNTMLNEIMTTVRCQNEELIILDGKGMDARLKQYGIQYGVYYLKDYFFSGNELKIDVGIMVLPSAYTPGEGYDASFTHKVLTKYRNYRDSARVDYNISLGIDEDANEIIVDGVRRVRDDYYWLVDDIYMDRNYFSDNTNKKLWNDYSDQFISYTMTYKEDENGEWHWVSCVQSNPETSDRKLDTVDYVMLTISTSMIFVILALSNRKHGKKTVKNQ